jgi:hypothetical protein
VFLLFPAAAPPSAANVALQLAGTDRYAAAGWWGGADAPCPVRTWILKVGSSSQAITA